MLDKLKSLASKANVSGAEDEMAAYVISLLQNVGADATLNEFGDVVSTIRGTEKNGKRILVCAPMDVPGFIALHIDSGKAYLSPTGNISKKIGEDELVLDEENRPYKLKKVKDEFYISGTDFHLGDTFRPDALLMETKSRIHGWMCTRFAQIQFLTELCTINPKNDLICAFTTAFETKASREVSLALEYCPDIVILIGSVEETTTLPVILIRDGKAFSAHEEIEVMKKLGIKTKEILSPENVTKAEGVFSNHGVSTVSLALPCTNKGEKNESFAIAAYAKLISLLKAYL